MHLLFSVYLLRGLGSKATHEPKNTLASPRDPCENHLERARVKEMCR